MHTYVCTVSKNTKPLQFMEFSIKVRKYSICTYINQKTETDNTVLGDTYVHKPHAPLN